ncbi:MAG TPA: VIT domain-containing protein [Xanthobacteraceae bacterium]|nr:VIT domain-containing protein [Xanthobacteraceae bacterium]
MAGSPLPCPLVATRFDVMIDAGLAVVTMRRTFRNAEPHSIEATITFPVPVHAALFALEVRIGERVLKARAQRKNAARQHYEAALDRGKTAILHEEVLRGVHMLSVGHIPPGDEIAVQATWAMTLTNLNGRGRLRIPLTVGDIYGRSGLSDSDALIHGSPLQTGMLTVDCRDGTATLLGGRLEDRQAAIALNVPIDIDVVGWSPRELHGRAADGSAVALRIEPYTGGEAALDLALMVDRSGSMGELCSSLVTGVTKHDVVVGAITALASQIGASDAIDLWEFDDGLRHIGSTPNIPLRDLVRQLAGPGGGTEIGRALQGVVAGAPARDVLLVTDGKSHALDVQALARCGRRFSVVLVGADSLEAYVGHLAALTGGEIFVAAGPELAAMLGAAIRSLRIPRQPARLEDGAVRERRAGMEITARWRAAGDAAAPTIETRAVAALAASLRLPALAEEAAAMLAEAEGLVTHLTSLVLVDEDAAAQQGIPATRKIALPSPDTFDAAPVRSYLRAASRPVGAISASRAMAAPPDEEMRQRRETEERRRCEALPSRHEQEARSRAGAEAKKRPAAEEPTARRVGAMRAARLAADDGKPERSTKAHSGKFKVESRRRSKRSLLRWYKDLFGLAPAAESDHEVAALSVRIDWNLAPQRLQEGDLSSVTSDLAQLIGGLAREPGIVAAAKRFGCAPVVLVIALLARAAADRSRAAERIARTILRGRPADDIEALLAQRLRELAPA